MSINKGGALPEVNVVKTEKDILNDRLDDGTRIRCLCVVLTSDKGQRSLGLSDSFNFVQAYANAYAALVNMTMKGVAA